MGDRSVTAPDADRQPTQAVRRAEAFIRRRPVTRAATADGCIGHREVLQLKGPSGFPGETHVLKCSGRPDRSGSQFQHSWLTRIAQYRQSYTRRSGLLSSGSPSGLGPDRSQRHRSRIAGKSPALIGCNRSRPDAVSTLKKSPLRCSSHSGMPKRRLDLTA